MQFVHGRIAQLSIVTDSNLVYLLHCILNIFEKFIFQSSKSSLFKDRLQYSRSFIF